MATMAEGERTPVNGGWMQAPGPDGKYPGDTVPVVLCGADGDPVAMTNLDVDYFGQIDDAMIPGELLDLAETLGLTAHYWDEPYTGR
jgi:hypothetical protein